MRPSIDQLFVHIGHAKTGTTVVQRSFAKARAALRTSGVLYPESANHIFIATRFHHAPTEMQPHRIRQRSAEEVERVVGPPFERLSADLVANRFEKALFSTENFTNLNRKSTKDLARWCRSRARETRVIVYVRHPVDFVGSWIQELVKNGNTRLDDLVGRLPFFRFSRHLPQWVEAFGRENVIVRPFERERLEGGDVVEDICRLMGIAPVPRVEDAEANKRVSMPAALIADALVGRLPQREIIRIKPYLLEIAGPRFDLPPEVAGKVRERAGEDLAYLEREFGIVLSDPGEIGTRLDRGEVFTEEAVASIADLLYRLATGRGETGQGAGRGPGKAGGGGAGGAGGGAGRGAAGPAGGPGRAQPRRKTTPPT